MRDFLLYLKKTNMDSQISFCVFDNMIHENPTKWMTLENNDCEVVEYLKYLNLWINNDEIGRLMIYDMPEEHHYMLNNCNDEFLKQIKNEILSNVN
jgi:hypothetical protein